MSIPWRELASGRGRGASCAGMFANLALSCVLLAAALSASPAAALTLRESGGVALLRGSIEKGDAKVLAAFFERPRVTPLRVIWLESGGGSLAEGILMAKEIRKTKIATAVDATGAYCDSACTFLFVAGAARHYVRGDRIMEGLSGLTGLGFHVSSIRGDRVRPSVLSDKGTQDMAAFYREFGVPGAADLAQKAMFNAMFRPNGETALKLGIATSLAPP